MKQTIGFFGGDRHTGTTMIAWSFAERLSEKGARVLLILGSGFDDSAMIPSENGRGLDDLTAALRSETVEREDILSCIEKKKQLWILHGTRNPLMAENFPETTFPMLLEKVGDAFEYVVIDGGCDVRLGLMISALKVCSHRYFVLTQQVNCLHRYGMYSRQLYRPFGVDGIPLLNQYRKDPAILLKKDVCQILGKENILCISHVDEGWQMEIAKKNLLSIPRFSKGIDHIVSNHMERNRKEAGWKKHFG